MSFSWSATRGARRKSKGVLRGDELYSTSSATLPPKREPRDKRRQILSGLFSSKRRGQHYHFLISLLLATFVMCQFLQASDEQLPLPSPRLGNFSRRQLLFIFPSPHNKSTQKRPLRSNTQQSTNHSTTQPRSSTRGLTTEFQYQQESTKTTSTMDDDDYEDERHRLPPPMDTSDGGEPFVHVIRTR